MHCRHARNGEANRQQSDDRSTPIPNHIGAAVAPLLSEDNRRINAERTEVSGGMFV
jgi:hypothetical protein